MFKISRKTTKEDLKDMLNANFKEISKVDKDLADSIVYAGKHSDKATRTDLIDLAKQVIEKLGAENVLAKPVLAETKKESETPAKETKKTSGAEKTEPKAENSVKPVKKVEPKAKKSSKKDEGVVALSEPMGETTQQRAKQFPATVNVGDEKYEVASDIKSMDDLYSASEKEEDIVLAFYFPKRNIRQFGYFNEYLEHPKSFPQDLDMTQVIYVSEERKVAYTVSLYTEAPYTVLPNDFEEVDGVKISGNLEFEVYRKKNDEK